VIVLPSGGNSHTSCEDLLRGATGCCSTVAKELVLCSDVRTARSVGYTGLSSQEGGVAQSRSSRKLERREEKVTLLRKTGSYGLFGASIRGYP
jgi:hypothetical protein